MPHEQKHAIAPTKLPATASLPAFGWPDQLNGRTQIICPVRLGAPLVDTAIAAGPSSGGSYGG